MACVSVRHARAGLLGLVGAAVLVGWPAIARAAALQPVAAGATAFASDGTRYVAWQLAGSSDAVELDTRTGNRGTVVLPPGCTIIDQEARNASPPAGAGRFLLECATGETRLLDLRSDSSIVLPAITPPAPGTPWLGVGSRYIEGEASRATCAKFRQRAPRSCLAFYNISTGSVFYRPLGRPGELDLVGAPPLCPVLGLKVAGERARVVSEAAFAYGHGLFVTAPGRTDITIDHCRRSQTLLRGQDEPGNFDLRAGLLTWDTGTPGTSFEAVFGGGVISKHPVLGAYDLWNGHRHAWALPRLPLIETVAHERIMGSFGYSTHTADDVFWIAATTVEQTDAGVTVTSSAIYAAARGRL